MTVSFTSVVQLEEGVERGVGRLGAPGRAVRRRAAPPRGRCPASVSLSAPGRARDEPVGGECVEDRLDVGRRGEDRLGDPGGLGEPLDRDDLEAPGPPSPCGPASGGVAPGSGASAAADVAAADLDPQLRRPVEERPDLGDDLGRAGDDALEHLAGPAVDRDDVARRERPARRSRPGRPTR